ncbi:MAG: ribonuclease HII [Candidatus Paceibacterota bacterium]|jgi:ribonuclease HII
MNPLHILGIDEAGRGPLAGPVSIGACVVPYNFDFSVFLNLKDSKKLSEKRREEIFLQMQALKKVGKLDFSVALVSHTYIDSEGISFAIRKGIEGVLLKLKADPEITKIFLDGSLKAPEIFSNQETIIKGDELVPAISLASIAAKVTRDRHMIKIAETYPEYSFEVHKGYGTSKHIKMIAERGLCDIHRRSFTRTLQKGGDYVK